MIRKILPITVALCAASGGASAGSISFLAAFTGDRLTELQTEEGDVCVFGDDSCYPAGFSPTEAVKSDLAPFAGLPVGTELPFRFDFAPFSEADCAIGDAFACDFGTSYDETTDGSGELVEFELFDGIGDYNLRVDLLTETVSFFGAAGDFLPGGCTAADGIAQDLPDGYCGFFGYEADFQLTSEVRGGIDEHITPVPLNASMMFALFGLASLIGVGRFKQA